MYLKLDGSLHHVLWRYAKKLTQEGQEQRVA